MAKPPQADSFKNKKQCSDAPTTTCNPAEFIEWTSLLSKSVQASYYNPFHLPYPLSPIDTKIVDGNSVLFASTPTKNIHEERPIELVPILLLDSRNPSYDSSTIESSDKDVPEQSNYSFVRSVDESHYAVPFTSNSQREKSLSLQQNGITSSINILVRISSRSTLPSRSRPYFYVPIPTHKSSEAKLVYPNKSINTQASINSKAPFFVPSVALSNVMSHFSHLIVATVYHPPTADDNVLINHITDTLSKIESTMPHAAIIIAGDFNCLNINQITNQFRLKQLVKFPTRGERTLDLILTNLAKFY